MDLREVFAVLVAAVAGYVDLKWGRVPNALVAFGFLMGFALNLLEGGARGLLSSLGGGCLGMALLFIPFALGGMGAGDVKLLGAIGALVGPRGAFFTLIYGALGGGIMAILVLLKNHRLLATLRSIAFGLVAFLSGSGGGKILQAGGDSSITFPYSLALGLGLIFAIILR